MSHPRFASPSASSTPSSSSSPLHPLIHSSHLPLFIPHPPPPLSSSPIDSPPPPPPPPPPRHPSYSPLLFLHHHHHPPPPSSPNGMHLSITCNSLVDPPDIPSPHSASSSASASASLLRYHSAPSSTLTTAISEQEPPLLSNFLHSHGRSSSSSSSCHDYSHPNSERQLQPQNSRQGGFLSFPLADFGALHQDLAEPHSNLCCNSGDILDRSDGAAAAAAGNSRFGGGGAADQYRHRSMAAAASPVSLLSSSSRSMVEEMEQGIASDHHRLHHPPPVPPPLCRSADFQVPVRMTRSGHGVRNSVQHNLQENGQLGSSEMNRRAGQVGGASSMEAAQSTEAEAKVQQQQLVRHGSSPAAFLKQAMMGMEKAASSGGNSSDEGGGKLMEKKKKQQDQYVGEGMMSNQRNWENSVGIEMAAAAAAGAAAPPLSSAEMMNEGYSRKRLQQRDNTNNSCDAFYSPPHHDDSLQQQNGSALEHGGLVNHFTLGTSTSPEDIYFTDRLSSDTVPCRVRAKRGCATHPRSIAERVRRTKISERMKKLQELVPNMDKQTNIAEMLDEAVEYVKGLQREIQKLTESQEKCRCSCNKSQEKD